MLTELHAFLAHFGEPADKNASHVGVVPRPVWDDIVTALASEAMSVATTTALRVLGASYAEVTPSTVVVQLAAGGLCALKALASASAAKAAPPAIPVVPVRPSA
jgi:hypothetical protein